MNVTHHFDKAGRVNVGHWEPIDPETWEGMVDKFPVGFGVLFCRANGDWKVMYLEDDWASDVHSNADAIWREAESAGITDEYFHADLPHKYIAYCIVTPFIKGGVGV